MATCTSCGSKLRKSTDDEYYFSGNSYICDNCEIGYTKSDVYESGSDERSGWADPDTSRNRRDWETDDDYNERMEDLDNF